LIEPSVQLQGKVVTKWDPANPAFARADAKTSVAQIEIALPKAERLTDPQTGAIEHQDQQAETPPGPRGATDVSGVSDDTPKLGRSEDVGQERNSGCLRGSGPIRDE
jgi:hypothetical protein